MSDGLAKSICLIHPDRPAGARCPSCRAFYCSECITEHSGKLICASCLAQTSVVRRTKKRVAHVLHPAVVLQFVAALLLCWTLFYCIARFLADMPDEFHDGTIWE